MVLQKIASRIPKPKVTFDSFGQLIFTFKEVSKLAAKTNPKLLITLFALNGLWGFSSLPGFYLEKLILDKIVSSIGTSAVNTALYSIGFLVGLRLLLELVRNILSRTINLLKNILSRLFSSELETLIGRKLAQLDLATIEDPDFKNRFEKVEEQAGRRAWGLMMPLSDIPNYAMGFLSSVGLLVALHPFIAVGVLIASTPHFFVDQKNIKKDYELDTELAPLRRLWGWMESYLSRNVSYLELKILNLSNYLYQRIRDIQKQVFTKWLNYRKQRELSNIIAFLPLTIFELTTSVWITSLVIVEKITIGSFEMYLRALRSTQSNLSGLVSSFLEVYENYIFVSDLIWFLNLEPQISDDSPGIKLDVKTVYPIKLNDVSFKYRTDQNWTVQKINVEIKPGDKLAIVGENGAGKSTLIKLIARFYDPQEGDIHIGDHMLKDIDIGQWRSKLGILFQKFETYPFTVQESVGYGDITRINNLKEIKEATHKTGIDEFIENLPLKYQNPLTPEFEKGVDLSAGQWQRVGIARMLFRKNADILIMDEPTSNVDPEAEEKIFNELLNTTSKGKILIFVSQRFSTVRRADKILVMDKGRLIEQGSHEELMKLNKKYARLFNLQAKGYQ